MNKITWGNNHKRYVKSIKEAELIAYYKAFYFDNVKLNDIKVERKL